MVRLKVYIDELDNYDYEISIPYGAIKRLSQKLAELNKNNFNSLWCD